MGSWEWGPGTAEICIPIKRDTRASEMAQQVKAFAVKSDDLSLTPGTHMIETKNQLLQIILWPQHGLCEMLVPVLLLQQVSKYPQNNVFKEVIRALLPHCAHTGKSKWGQKESGKWQGKKTVRNWECGQTLTWDFQGYDISWWQPDQTTTGFFSLHVELISKEKKKGEKSPLKTA